MKSRPTRVDRFHFPDRDDHRARGGRPVYITHSYFFVGTGVYFGGIVCLCVSLTGYLCCFCINYLVYMRRILWLFLVVKFVPHAFRSVFLILRRFERVLYVLWVFVCLWGN